MFLAMVVLLYAAIGVQLFAHVVSGVAINEQRNFETFASACIVLLQLITGDGWSYVMTDLMAVELPANTTLSFRCASWLAVTYFISFYFICSLLLIVMLASLNDAFTVVTTNHVWCAGQLPTVVVALCITLSRVLLCAQL